MLCRVERLEYALRAWEDYYFIFNATSKLQKATGQNLGISPIPYIGAVRHWAELRKHLLTIRNIQQFDIRKFMLPTEVSQKLPTDWPRLMSHFPGELAVWIWESRRVFRITKELQVLLGATLLDDVRWCDVSWPFSSFVVLLDIPIESPYDCEYDCILVSSYSVPDEPEGVVSFRIMSTLLNESQRVISPKKQRRLTRLIREKKWQEASVLLANHKLPRLPVDPFYVSVDEKRPVVDSLAEVSCGRRLTNLEAPHWDIAAQLVVGFCLYLNTLPPGTSHKSDWKPVPESLVKPNPNSITDESQICSVSSIVKLQKKDLELIGIDGPQSSHRTFYELCAHFRRGHWRRRPGEGHDPDAPRTVWVRPTLVRRDRLQEGAIVGGSENVVS